MFDSSGELERRHDLHGSDDPLLSPNKLLGKNSRSDEEEEKKKGTAEMTGLVRLFSTQTEQLECNDTIHCVCSSYKQLTRMHFISRNNGTGLDDVKRKIPLWKRRK